MRNSSLLILFIILWTKGNTQVKLTFFNNSSAVVDSIKIAGKTSFILGPIEKNNKITFWVTTDQANFHSFAPFYVHVYSPLLCTKIQWMKSGFSDSIYFFDNGLSLKNQAPHRPEYFYVTIYNANPIVKDTIYANNNVVKEIKEITPRSRALTLYHEKIPPDQAISFKLGEKTLTADLTPFNLNDWHNQYAYLYIYNDSVFSEPNERLPEYEYMIRFEAQGVNLKDIQINSRHLLKTYSYQEYNTIRAVFNYLSFKSDPQFTIKVKRKVHHIILEKEEVEERKYEFYFITKENIKKF